ncbi:MAG TPA: ABATE domain-containing protein, partial [Crenalkalicoccus sp.]|nr:ABATE domain-containing protein [Crenalkalicoccus sp.]
MTPREPWVPAPAETLCLDFANTLYWRGSPRPTEELDGPPALLRWATAARLLDPASLATLAAGWEAAPAAAVTGFAEAIALREAIYALFGEAAEPPAAPLGALNEALAAAPRPAGLRRAGEGWAWALPPGPPDAAML